MKITSICHYLTLASIFRSTCVCACVYGLDIRVGFFPPFSCFLLVFAVFRSCFWVSVPFDNLCLFCTFKNCYSKILCLSKHILVHCSLLALSFSFSLMILSSFSFRMAFFSSLISLTFSLSCYDPFVCFFCVETYNHLVFV